MAWLALPNGTVILGHGPFTPAADFPTHETAFYLQDFALSDPTPWKIPSHTETLTQAELTARFHRAPRPDIQWDPIDAVPFSAVFQEIMTAIHGGLFEKTVPVVIETGTCAQSPARSIIAAMARQTHPHCSYGWSNGSHGFAGATPELLISLDKLHLATMALAGTARHDDRDVFAVDEKEIREHEYVAQTLVAKLTDLGTLHRQPRGILDLGPIVHFLTTIAVHLESPQHPEALIKRLHPTPALGPLPRTAETLAKLITWRQRLGCPPHFGAPFGVHHQGHFQAIVAIRGLWWQNHQVILPAGCGIIEASRLVNEWRELRLKRESVKRFLA